MSIVTRGACILMVLLSLSCSGPLEEMGGIQTDLEPFTPAPPTTVSVRSVPGEYPVEITRAQLRDTLRFLAPQLNRLVVDPTLSERRLLMDETSALMPQSASHLRLLQASAERTDELDREILRQYSKHCEDLHSSVDCLGVLDGRSILTGKARYKIACHFALAAVWDGIRGELQDMADLERVERAVVSGVVVYLALVSIPEPISKVLAAALTAAMVAWLGLDTLEKIIGGWVDMVTAANRALTFDELRAAGEEYGRRIGEQTLRIVVMLVASAISEKGLANLPKVPRFELASRRLAIATGGPGLNVVPEIQEATVAPGKITLVLAKAVRASQVATAAVAGAGPGTRGQTRCREQTHHIATIENTKATWNGGPWTPRFQDLFARVGLSMSDEVNTVRVWGHQGPHPEPYHQAIYDSLKRVLDRCETQDICRKAFIRQLQKFGADIATPGTKLNEWVTQGCGKRN
jgi:A nuclease family of the HNH/ENDO VII superfamily with conserved AHH